MWHERSLYLGSQLTSNGKCVKDVRRRIGIAKSAFSLTEKVIKDRNIDLKLRNRVLQCYVWSTLLYGCETWTLSADIMDTLESTEIWFYRRMLHIS